MHVANAGRHLRFSVAARTALIGPTSARRAIGVEPLDESLAGSKKFADYVAALA